MQRREVAEDLPSSTYRDRLATESGRTALQIMEETARRAAVLKTMQRSGRFPDIAAVTRFCQRYSQNAEKALVELGAPLERGAMPRRRRMP